MPQTLSTFLAIALAFPTVAADPPTIKLPAEVRGEPGDWITVTAETNGKSVRWVPFAKELKLFPPGLLRESKTAVVVCNRPGRHRLLAYTAAGDEPSDPAIVVIVIEGPVPPPPPEPPGPTPPGPSPPGPTPPPTPPIPPGPVDPLTQRLQAALAGDPGTVADKAKYAAALSGFYAAMAKHVGEGSVATVGDLLSDYRAAIPSILPDGAIPATRKAAGAEVAVLAGDDTEKSIDPALRAKFVDLFNKLAAALTPK
jgi:hypothetical protein